MTRMLLLGVLAAAAMAGEATTAMAGQGSSNYAIVVSEKTLADPAWKQVVEALRDRRSGAVHVYRQEPRELGRALRDQFPRFACFVATPAEVGREFVAAAHRLTRALDDDPYPDCFWGILTGYDAADALRAAREPENLTVRRVTSATEVALDACEEGVWYCELKRNRMVRKAKGGSPETQHGPDDTTEAIARRLIEGETDLFVTSGHATERDWMIGYGYTNGVFKCAQGQLYGLDTAGRRLPIRSENPKVYLPVGNCLMGHIDGPEAMALAYQHSAGVRQMIGYTVPTWYGYAGWGCLDYFLEQPGRFSLAEAFLANQVALVHRLQTFFPDALEAEVDLRGRTQTPIAVSEQARQAGLRSQDARGLLFDRNTLAFYGDPAWVARMAPGSRAWEQLLTCAGHRYTFEVKAAWGERTFAPVNRNGSQRGGRPIIEFLPHRVRNVRLLEGADLAPVVADDFVLAAVYKLEPGKCTGRPVEWGEDRFPDCMT